MIVVDTNVMIHLLMGGEHGPDAALLLQQDPEWAAPVILMSELRNVLLGFVRRGVFVSDHAKAMTDDAATILETVSETSQASRCSTSRWNAASPPTMRSSWAWPGHWASHLPRSTVRSSGAHQMSLCLCRLLAWATVSLL